PTVYRIEMSSGVATNPTNRSRKDIVRVRLEADAMFTITGPAPVCAVRLFSWASKSSVSLPMKSTIWASTASEALKDTALRTVTSSLSPLRPRSWAMLRMRAAASLVTFSWRVPPMSPPVADTGDAAPMLVPGAIAAKLAAAKMNVPADAARAPLGATYTATGTLAASRRWTILRVASYMPPGVSSWMTKSAARSCSAWLTAWAINPCVTWSMLRLTVMKGIVGGADWLAGSRSRPAVVITPQARIRMPSQTRRRTTMLTPHPGRLEEGPPVAAMIDCSPPLVNRSDGARTHGYCCGLWIAAGPGTRESQPALSRGQSGG